MITDAAINAQQSTHVWPESVAGWVALFTSIAALIGIAIAYGRWIEKLNGMGERVKVLEEAKQRSDGAEIERIRILDRVLNQHESLIREIGEAKSAASQASDDGETTARSVRDALEVMTTSVNKMNLDLSNRMTAVETILKVRSADG